MSKPADQQDEAWAGMPTGPAAKPPKKKPFQNCKPRSEWKNKKYGDRARGKLVHEVVLVDGSGVPGDKVSFDVKLTPRGLVVHRYNGRKSKDMVWTLDHLVKPAIPAGKGGQIRLL